MKRTNLRLSLISEGAECIFISKKLFLKHASGDALRRVNALVGRYPTEDYIRNQLHEHADWCNFRKNVVKDILDRREEKLEMATFLKANQ